MSDNPYESPQTRQEARPLRVTNTRRVVFNAALGVMMCFGATTALLRGKYLMAAGGLALALYALQDAWITWKSTKS